MKRKTPIARTLVTAGLPLLVLAVVLTDRVFFAEAADGAGTEANTKVVLASEVEWTPLNPARGDSSPQAGTLWGDRAGSPQTGFLVKFADGFSSPPHIHNVTYRGVVISGQIHNDDPEAEPMWMPSGSFWTQPAGEVHITAAKGEMNMAYIEIDHGPYLVWPPEKATDNGERPVNVHESNLVWLDAASTTWIEGSEGASAAGGAKIAFVWGKPESGETNGTLLKLPAGFSGEIRSDGAALKAVVIKGQAVVRGSGAGESKTLDPGSYFSSEGTASHQIQLNDKQESILYLRAEGRFKVVSVAATE